MKRLWGDLETSFNSSSHSLLRQQGVSDFRPNAPGSLRFHPLFSCLLRRQGCGDQQGSGGRGSNYFHSLSCLERVLGKRWKACLSLLSAKRGSHILCKVVLFLVKPLLVSNSSVEVQGPGVVYGRDVTRAFSYTTEVGLQTWKIHFGVEAFATTFKLI